MEHDVCVVVRGSCGAKASWGNDGTAYARSRMTFAMVPDRYGGVIAGPDAIVVALE